MRSNALAYEADFYGWTMEQARLLRDGQLSDLDVQNVAEELESMGRSARHELESRLEVLLLHLLKWQLQEGFRSRSWAGTIREQRRRIEDRLEESPSLRSVVEDIPSRLYRRARRAAINETGLQGSHFPRECPFTPEQVLSPEFLPED